MSSDELEIFIDSLWEKLDAGRDCRSEIILEQIDIFVDEKNQAQSHIQLNNWLILYSEYICWFHFLALELKNKLLAHPPRPDSFFITMVAISQRVASELAAVRMLVIKGFEGQARLVARSAVENLDLMIVAPHNAKITSEFVKLSSNEFWYRYVRKGRLRKQANRLIDARGIYNKSWKYYRQAEDELQSEHSHPSRWSGGFSMYPDAEGYDEWPAHWGRRTSASVRTLAYLCAVCDNLLLINDFIPFEGHRVYSPLIQRDFNNSSHQQIDGGRKVIEVIQSYLAEKIDTELFKVPKSALEPED